MQIPTSAASSSRDEKKNQFISSTLPMPLRAYWKFPFQIDGSRARKALNCVLLHSRRQFSFKDLQLQHIFYLFLFTLFICETWIRWGLSVNYVKLKSEFLDPSFCLLFFYIGFVEKKTRNNSQIFENFGTWRNLWTFLIKR